MLAFDPARDGFGFPNVFAWTPEDLTYLNRALRPLTSALTVGLPALAGGLAGGKRGALAGAGAGTLLAAAHLPDALVRGVARGWPSFGLCGGMALAALERWPSRAEAPTVTLPREALRPLLRNRQAATLRRAGARFLRAWLAVRRLPPAERLCPPFGEALQHELDHTRALLDAGRPFILGLVGDAPDPFAMHQVVCFGYEEEGDALRLLVYDPNAPGQTRHVRARVTPEGRCEVTTDLPTGLRGAGRFHLATRPDQLSTLFVVWPSPEAGGGNG